MNAPKRINPAGMALPILLGAFLILSLIWAAPCPAKEEVYLIGPSDILEVLVWREDSLSRTEVLVRPDGRITMPLVDDVQAAGLTPMQLKAILINRLRKFVEAPKVYVTVKNPRSHTFSILGNVIKAGNYAMLKPTNVLQALALAEGFNEWAKKDKVVIIRGSEAAAKRLPFNYENVVAGEGMEQNIILEPGDVIIVP